MGLGGWMGLDISGHVVDVRCGGCGEWETGYSHQFFPGLFCYIFSGIFCALQKILQIFAVILRSAPLGRSQAGP